MPRKNPVPQREREICQRLREFRAHTKLSQRAFAREVGVDSNALASYELGRVPLKHGLIARVGQRFDLNQRWLADGTGDKVPYIELPADVVSAIPDACLFSTAYDQWIKKIVAEWEHTQVARKVGLHTGELMRDLAPDAAVSSWASVLPNIIKGVVTKLPENLRKEYVNTVLAASFKFEHTHRPAIVEHVRKLKKR